MRTRLVASMMMIASFAAPLCAQERATETAAWQSLAATLQPGAFVEVRLKDGAHFKGTFMQRSGDRVVVKPRTRVPVPAREIPFADLESIEVAKKGMSPGMKVLIGVGASIATITVIGLLALANSY
jgi:hypothetical protein